MKLNIKNALLGAILICIVPTAYADEISKDVWMDSISTALPIKACQSKQYFRQCFDVNQVECENTVLSATRICLEKYKDKIPNPLNQPVDGKHWGSVIGKCAGGAYEMVFNESRIDSKNCNDPANWK